MVATNSHSNDLATLSFENIIYIIIFLVCIFVSSRLLEMIHMPGLVGSILVGSLLGTLW